MLYSIIKAFHIVFIVSYFAGIFYLVRIFVYYKDTDEFEETKKKILREQYVFMARRLEYHYRTRRNHHACNWNYDDNAQPRINENTLVSPQINFPNWPRNLSLLVLEKIK